MTTSNPSENVFYQDGVTVIALGREYENLDDAVLESVRKVILDGVDSANPPVVVLDLSHTKFFGSAFIEILFRAWNRLEGQTGGQFCLCGLTPYCAEVIDVTHLNRIWEVYDNREDAVAALKRENS